MLKLIWKNLALFFYRRWCKSLGEEGRKPDGVPGNRDPDSPCTGYAPRPYQIGDWRDCQTDGHYLCKGCCHRDVSGREPASTNWLHVSTVE